MICNIEMLIQIRDESKWKNNKSFDEISEPVKLDIDIEASMEFWNHEFDGVVPVPSQVGGLLLAESRTILEHAAREFLDEMCALDYLRVCGESKSLP